MSEIGRAAVGDAPASVVEEATRTRRRAEANRARARQLELQLLELRIRAGRDRRRVTGPVLALFTGSPMEPTGPSAGRPTVLVVDDDEAVRESIAALLDLSGYRILTAADGEEALQTLQREAVDVMVLDLWMPRRNGLSVLMDLPLRAPAVILHTATEDVSAEISPELLQSKVFLSLRKPVSPGLLLSAIGEAIDHVPSGWPLALEPGSDGAGPPEASGRHGVTRAVIRSGNRWFAHLSCACGWTQSVGPVSDEGRLGTAMDLAEMAHRAT